MGQFDLLEVVGFFSIPIKVHRDVVRDTAVYSGTRLFSTLAALSEVAHSPLIWRMFFLYISLHLIFKARVTQPSPRHFLHVCTVEKKYLHESPNLVAESRDGK